ncbi:MAG: single-stranded DNA-binding protein [Microbacteriaceae bacterium]
MANKTPITVVGNLTADPDELRQVGSDDVTNFNIAVTDRVFDRQKNEWVDGKTSFYRVAVWRYLAKNVAASLKKGQRVIVTGDLNIVNWEKDGKSGTQAEITADDIGPSLTFGTAQFQRSTGGNHGQFTTGNYQPGGQQQGQAPQGGVAGFDPNLPAQEASYGAPGGGQQAQQQQQYQQQAPQGQQQQAPQQYQSQPAANVPNGNLTF